MERFGKLPDYKLIIYKSVFGHGWAILKNNFVVKNNGIIIRRLKFFIETMF